MVHAEAAGPLRVEIVAALRAGEVERIELTLPAGATLGDALRAAAFTAPAGCDVAVWGRLLDPATAAGMALRDRDRIEFLRSLAVDPKEARRRRAHGAKTTARRGGRLRAPCRAAAAGGDGTVG